MMMMISNTAIATSTDSTIASATSIFFILENDDVHRGESDDVHHDAEDQDKTRAWTWMWVRMRV